MNRENGFGINVKYNPYVFIEQEINLQGEQLEPNKWYKKKVEYGKRKELKEFIDDSVDIGKEPLPIENEKLKEAYEKIVNKYKIKK